MLLDIYVYAQRHLDSSTFEMLMSWKQFDCVISKMEAYYYTKYVFGLHKMLNTVCFQAHFTFSVESRFSACQSCSSFYRKPRTRLWRKLRNCSCPRNTKPRGKRNRRKSTSTTTADTWIVPKCNEPEKYIPDVKHLQLSYDLTQLPVCCGSRYPFVQDVKCFCIIVFASWNMMHLFVVRS